jgi:hypothetical protein
VAINSLGHADEDRQQNQCPAQAIARVQRVARDPIAPAPLVNVFLRDKKLILYETAVVFG